MFNAEADTFRMFLFHEVAQTNVKAFRLEHSNAFEMREVIDEIDDRWLQLAFNFLSQISSVKLSYEIKMRDVISNEMASTFNSETTSGMAGIIGHIITASHSTQSKEGYWLLHHINALNGRGWVTITLYAMRL